MSTSVQRYLKVQLLPWTLISWQVNITKCQLEFWHHSENAIDSALPSLGVPLENFLKWKRTTVTIAALIEYKLGFRCNKKSAHSADFNHVLLNWKLRHVPFDSFSLLIIVVFQKSFLIRILFFWLLQSLRVCL